MTPADSGASSESAEDATAKNAVTSSDAKPDALTPILDRAYAEWQEAGFPAGEGVVHLWQFQRAGLWQPHDLTSAGWTRCAREGCGFVAFDRFDYCPDHLAAGGAK